MRPVILSRLLTAFLAVLLVQNAFAIEVNPEDESGFISYAVQSRQMTYMYLPDSLPQRCRQDRRL